MDRLYIFFVLFIVFTCQVNLVFRLLGRLSYIRREQKGCDSILSPEVDLMCFYVCFVHVLDFILT